MAVTIISAFENLNIKPKFTNLKSIKLAGTGN